MDFTLFSEILTIFGLSVAVIYLCHKVRIPPIVGFLITGVIAGPYGLGLVSAVHEVEILAEVGVVLLLFTIGLELSMGELVRLRKSVLLGGGGQVLFSIVAFGALAYALGQSISHSVFVGFLAALSSTAIVLKIFQQRAEMDSVHGRISLSILIFQDLVIVPMMLVIPFLAGQAGGQGGSSLSFLWPTLKGIGMVGLVFFLARKVVPRLLHRIVQTRSRELFLICTLTLCLATAFLTSQVGLSLSLGAFLAGLIISESEYSLSALEGIMPFRDVFTSLFFISVGMLLDVGYLASHVPSVAGATLAVLGLKALMAALAAYMLGFPVRPAVLVGLALCQIGEFSFVLAKAGLAQGLIDAQGYQLFLAASIMTMALTPPLISLSPRAADWMRALPLFARLAKRPFEQEMEQACEGHACVADHLVIVGFGVGGRHLARAAKNFGISYRIVEMNPDTVRQSAAEGEPIIYGDASQNAVLEHVGAQNARVLAVVVSDPVSIRGITDAARKLNPALHIITRTRFLSEMGPLLELGASDVIPEEFETSVEIFTRVMMRYLVPRGDIEHFTEEVRSEGYEMLRSTEVRGESFCTLNRQFPGMDVSALTVELGSILDGQTLEESELRRTHGLTVVAVGREGEVMANPDGSLRLEAGDVAYVFGPHADIAAKAGLFTGRKRPWERFEGTAPA
ncbi:MAG: cation:proton antiporter [Humidesulfovibrio sp.]|uniref:monovalent cation:proton antiporter family protein n=1 Tax=Humidesulfovibrio sp. TaxID=2910988 RepID=UPI0027376A9F|nr:monovalent cation:proton antiporter family protein [Humidesulfovibrio sp.]MDP2846681.1 cation:proton antiporter [Humidesulfovibrio sp.]